jgi:hypothetical protein
MCNSKVVMRSQTRSPSFLISSSRRSMEASSMAAACGGTNREEEEEWSESRTANSH